MDVAFEQINMWHGCTVVTWWYQTMRNDIVSQFHEIFHKRGVDGGHKSMVTGVSQKMIGWWLVISVVPVSKPTWSGPWGCHASGKWRFRLGSSTKTSHNRVGDYNWEGGQPKYMEAENQWTSSNWKGKSSSKPSQLSVRNVTFPRSVKIPIDLKEFYPLCDFKDSRVLKRSSFSRNIHHPRRPWLLLQHHRVASWWLNHPFEKYAEVKMDSSSPKFGVKIKTIFEAATT